MKNFKVKLAMFLLFLVLASIPVSTMLALEGKINYRQAQEIMMKGEGSDSDIEWALYNQGFNLEWHEDVTNIDYIISPLRKTFRHGK